MITPRNDLNETGHETPSTSASSIADIQFWIDHPSLDDLTNAQDDSDRQQVRSDVEQCFQLLEELSGRVDPSKRDLANSDDQSLGAGRYANFTLLGVGAFGVVIRARDHVLNRDVAIKILRPSVLMSKRAVARFSLEGEALARCNFEGIVPIHEVGQINGIPYIIMGFVDGPTLADYLMQQGGPVPIEQAVRIVASVADAVHRSHQRGILHRDLKPSNVLLGNTSKEDSKLPFTPYVTDFGLAKDLLPDDNPNKHGNSHETPIVGTVSYMSPEQATGRNDEVSVTSDVFSLGVILYQLLTQCRPFTGKTTFEITQNILSSQEIPVRRLNHRVSRELDAIVQKSLSKKAENRYQSAKELSDDLQRFLDCKPVSARPASFAHAIGLWARRNPSLATSIAVILMGLFFGTLSIALLYRQNLLQLRSLSELYEENLEHLNAVEVANAKTETSFSLALNSIDKIRHVAEKTLNNVPQSAERKLELHLLALKISEELVENREGDEASSYRLSIAHHLVANDAQNSLQFDLEKRHRQKCIAILEELAKKHPNSAKYQFDLFTNHFLVMQSHYSSEEFLAKLKRARSYLQAAIQLDPLNADYEDADAAACLVIGTATVGFDRNQARDWLTLAINKSEDLEGRHPDKPIYLKHAIGGHLSIASMEMQDQNWPASIEHCEQAKEILDRRAEGSKDFADITSTRLRLLEIKSEALEHVDVSMAIQAYEEYIQVSLSLENYEKKFNVYCLYRAKALFRQSVLHLESGDKQKSMSCLTSASEAIQNYEPPVENQRVEITELRSKIKKQDAELRKHLE